MSSNNFRKRKAEIDSSIEKTINDLEKGYCETVRVRNIVENTREILDDLDNQFCLKTGLTKTDMGFLFTAIWSYVNILDTKSQTFLCCTSS